jgi:hypothetical protein
MPLGGRPSGRRERERWERQLQQYLDENRFEEMSSDEDGNGRRGVGVPSGAKKPARRSVSDELFFNDGASRHPRTHSDENLAYGERYESSEEYEEEYEEEDPGETMQMVRQNSADLIAQRALNRIERAKAKGKPAVNLTHEELEALERRYSRQSPSPERPERARKRSSPKGKRSPSQSNGAWTRRKTSRRPSLLASATAPPKQRAIKSGKQDSEPNPPGFMVAGPGGAPVYSPLGYYATGQPSARRTVSAGEQQRYSPPLSRGSSRSTSNSSIRHAPTSQPQAPYETPPYPSNRHHYASQDPRPTSTSSRTSPLLSDSEYLAYQTYPSSGRRVASGPPEVSYSNLYRRVPAPATSAAPRGRMQPSTSDPALHFSDRRPSGLGNEYEPTTESSSDDGSDDARVTVVREKNPEPVRRRRR